MLHPEEAPAAGKNDTDWLLAPKLSAPRLHPHSLRRARLVSQLRAGQNARLTLITAPAGYGKTALAATWLSEVEAPVAWLTLDRADNDPTRFFRYLIAALNRLDPCLGGSAAHLLDAPAEVGVDALVSALVADMAGGRGAGFLVLDDFHVVTEGPVAGAVDLMLQHLPPQLHVVILTRDDDRLSLGRLRVALGVNELRTEDLRFTIDEVQELFNTILDFDLSVADVMQLIYVSEGWAAGLRLIAVAAQNRSGSSHSLHAFDGSHRYIVDYLAEEILEQQPHEIEAFLIETSVLGRLSASLCDAVTLRNDSGEILERLEQANLFISPLDGSSEWYRYHPLFREFLYTHLNRDIEPDLHQRASLWCEANGYANEAIRHALAAGQVDRVTRLVKANACALVECEDLATVVDWLSAIPDESLRSRPWLCIANAWALIYAGRFTKAESLLGMASAGLGAAENDEEARALQGHILAIHAYLGIVYGDFAWCVRYAQQALEVLPQTKPEIRSLVMMLLGFANRWLARYESSEVALRSALVEAYAADSFLVLITTNSELGELQLARGQLTAAQQSFKDLIHLVGDYGAEVTSSMLFIGLAHARLAAIHSERCEPEEALRLARDGVRLCIQWGRAEATTMAYFDLARALMDGGHAEDAQDVLDQAADSAAQISPWFELRVKACQTQLYLQQGQVDAAARLWEDEDLVLRVVQGDLSPQYFEIYLAIAQLRIAQRDLAAAVALLERVTARAGAAGMGYVHVQALILLAVALAAAGREPEALRTLLRAVEQAEPEGYVQSFVAHGAVLGRLLERILEGLEGGLATYVRRLLGAIERRHGAPAAGPGPAAEAAPPLDEPLSERELDILRLIAAGLSNQEIADRLSITLGTAKWHVINIYRKLDVHSRVQAVSRAQDSHLL